MGSVGESFAGPPPGETLRFARSPTGEQARLLEWAENEGNAVAAVLVALDCYPMSAISYATTLVCEAMLEEMDRRRMLDDDRMNLAVWAVDRIVRGENGGDEAAALTTIDRSLYVDARATREPMRTAARAVRDLITMTESIDDEWRAKMIDGVIGKATRARIKMGEERGEARLRVTVQFMNGLRRATALGLG